MADGSPHSLIWSKAPSKTRKARQPTEADENVLRIQHQEGKGEGDIEEKEAKERDDQGEGKLRLKF